MVGFRFKRFEVRQDLCAMKVGTDGVLLGAWATGGRRVLDIGTGTGLIAMMMAQRFGDASITALDIDHAACEQAMANVVASPYQGRIEVVETSLQDFATQHAGVLELRYDSIVSNPPFFANSLKNPDQRRATARHTDTLSYADLFRGVSPLLADSGEFSTIIPVDCLSAFVAEGYIFGLSVKRKCAVRTVMGKQPKRCLVSFTRRNVDSPDVQEVSMRDDNGGFTPWYKALTNDFYLGL